MKAPAKLRRALIAQNKTQKKDRILRSKGPFSDEFWPLGPFGKAG
jgi:hypothetical protein